MATHPDAAAELAAEIRKLALPDERARARAALTLAAAAAGGSTEVADLVADHGGIGALLPLLQVPHKANA
jgi:hypothetical protein